MTRLLKPELGCFLDQAFLHALGVPVGSHEHRDRSDAARIASALAAS